MTQLTLTIEKSPNPQLAGRIGHFGTDGGTLGRSGDCSMVLPDPERLTSSIHARIEYAGGAYKLVDTSTNGTYHNSPGTLIGKNRSVTLEDGDRLYIGDFVLRVDLEESFSAPPDPVRAPTAAPAAQPDRQSKVSADDDWDLGEFSLAWGSDEEDSADDRSFKSESDDDEPSGGFSNSPEREFFSPPSSGPARQEAIPDDWDDFLTGFHGAGGATSQASTADEEPPRKSSKAESAPQEGFDDGIDPLDSLIDPPAAAAQPEPFPAPDAPGTRPDSPAQMPSPPAAPASPPRPPASSPTKPSPDSAPADQMQEILRTVTRGLMVLLQSRSEIKNEFRISQTRFAQTENNPLKFSPDPDEALKRVLGGGESHGFLTGARAFEDALKDIQAHQLAILSAVQRAIEASIAQFDPVELEKKLQRISPISAKTPGLKAAKCWNLFTVHYDEVAGRMRDDARQLFLTEFAEAYEEASSAIARRAKQDE
ncbi:MAG: type VI secretion system-associated FHA domain protein TagH [Wenzhouxiangella sp.]